MLYKNIVKPIMFSMDPENAHHVMIDGLYTAGKVPGTQALFRTLYGVRPVPELGTTLFGIPFSNPVGLAAGLDKNAKAIGMFSNIGFGFAEVGTVTPKAQPGNELPRLFRLPADDALINRMGFNNDGTSAMGSRLAALKSHPIPIAVNIGKNKVTPNELAHEDYRQCLQDLYEYGDFFVVNISSPNTPGLRNLQHGAELKLLLDTVMGEAQAQATRRNKAVKPVLVKIAPDMTLPELEQTVETITASGISGIIATNTTLTRDGLTDRHKGEAGGLSGKPLTQRSTEIIRQVYQLTGGKLPIIGSGGIFTAQDAYDKICAGASLVEVYTALIYRGPALLKELNAGLVQLLRRDGFSNIQAAVGSAHN